jgi:hypothetical protein
MALDVEMIAKAAKAETAPLFDLIAKEVEEQTGKSPTEALALTPKEPPSRTGLLYRFLTALNAEQRIARLKEITEILRKELPAVLAKTPLVAMHFGFKTVAQLADYIASALVDMETSATSEADFIRGIKGWQSNLVGRVVFERLVKYHPQLSAFFRATAKDFIRLANSELTHAFEDVFGKATKVTSFFGEPLKVFEFKLVGADGVTRAFTDFGFIARNAEGRWVMLPIEIKLPAALGGVAGQFSEFLPRLGEAQELVALVEEGGQLIEKRIAPADIVLMRHDTGQMAVAPLSQKQFQAALARGDLPSAKIAPKDVASIVTVDQRTSPSRGMVYYHTRVLVERGWLESIVRVLTHTPK